MALDLKPSDWLFASGLAAGEPSKQSIIVTHNTVVNKLA